LDGAQSLSSREGNPMYCTGFPCRWAVGHGCIEFGNGSGTAEQPAQFDRARQIS
jgi:hypothetical protein